LTELQDAVNLQAQNLCNAVGVIQQVAQPSFFPELNWTARASRPEYQALFPDQSQQGDIAFNFASAIAATAKQIEILINSLPGEEVSLELQDEANRRHIRDYRAESAKLVQLITHGFQHRLSAVRRLLSRIAETQLLARTLENECLLTDWHGFCACFRPTKTSMDAESLPPPTAPTEVDTGTLEGAYFLWTSHLYFCLAVVFLSRLVGSLLPVVLPFLVNNLPSARARRSAYSRTEKEIRDLRRQMAGLNMVDNFAAYSKLERKLRSLERQQVSSEQSQFGTSLVTGVVAKTLRLALNGLMIAWLVFNSPTTDLAKDQLAKASAQTVYGLPVGFFIFLAHYVPNRILTVFWIALCEAASSASISWFTTRLTSLGTSSSSSPVN
uniref:Mediator of RNA polymerase II transcription subunit 21 n=1 Tax=Schistocephalus solidus TaxID=70667 RepID=A0A183TAR9_SCHSO